MVCSDLKRALHTAQTIGVQICTAPFPLAELREFNNGIAASKSQEEADQITLPMTLPTMDWQPYPGGETWRQVHLRISTCMSRLGQASEDLLVVVPHGGAIINIVAW